MDTSQFAPSKVADYQGAPSKVAHEKVAPHLQSRSLSKSPSPPPIKSPLPKSPSFYLTKMKYRGVFLGHLSAVNFVVGDFARGDFVLGDFDGGGGGGRTTII